MKEGWGWAWLSTGNEGHWVTAPTGGSVKAPVINDGRQGRNSISSTRRSSIGSHDVDLLCLREAEDLFGSGTHHFVVLADGQQGVVAVDVSVRQHHGRVVLIHDLPGNLTDQSGVGAVGHRQRLGQFIERLTANWAVWVFGGTILFVALGGLDG